MGDQNALFNQYESEYCSISTEVARNLQVISTVSPGATLRLETEGEGLPRLLLLPARCLAAQARQHGSTEQRGLVASPGVRRSPRLLCADIKGVAEMDCSKHNQTVPLQCAACTGQTHCLVLSESGCAVIQDICVVVAKQIKGEGSSGRWTPR